MAIPTKESSFAEPTDRLLDPGPRPRPKRKVGCKCVLKTVVVLLGLLAAWIVFLFFRSVLMALKNPHSKLYQDLTQPYRPQDVVRPLIDSNQTFDIIATVWLRVEQSPESDKLAQPGHIAEKAIFSETVFTGLTLKDKQLTTSVNFQVPTSIFKQKTLNNYDLRGSFVLVPTPTSLLDHVHNYSSWIPSEAGYPPVRSWINKPESTLKDQVIDSYGTFTPLLTFCDIKSRCPALSNDSWNGDDEWEPDEEDVQQDETTVLPLAVLNSRRRWTSTKGKPVLATHPYIITRSFVVVADMTEVLNKAAYDNIHNALKAISCGRLAKVGGHPAHPRWQDCLRFFSTNGNQEVRIKINRPTGKNGKSRTEWLYAPYVVATQNGWGPYDLVHVPVDREGCLARSDNNTFKVLEEEYINVTWNIAFAGRSPLQLLYLEQRDMKAHKHSMIDKVKKHRFQQQTQESMDGLYGHRHRQGYHPRWHLALNVIRNLIFYASAVLEFLYWYTRSSTTGISVSGTAILAVATLLSLVMDTACLRILVQEKSVWELSFFWSLFTERACRGIMMLKAITRAEIVPWRKTWIPVIRFSPATHSERTSQRLDSRTTWRFKAIIYASLATFFTIIYRLNYYLIFPRGAVPTKKNWLSISLYAFPRCGILPALVLGRLLQIVLNFRSKTFAGMYRTTAYVKTLEMIVTILSRSPWIVGEALVNAPFTYFDLFELVGFMTLAYQSHRYSVASDVDDEDSTR